MFTVGTGDLVGLDTGAIVAEGASDRQQGGCGTATVFKKVEMQQDLLNYVARPEQLFGNLNITAGIWTC
jgi:hypothetical protein